MYQLNCKLSEAERSEPESSMFDHDINVETADSASKRGFRACVFRSGR